MLNDSWVEYLLIRATILALQSVGPLSTAYAFSLLLQAFILPTNETSKPLQLIANLLVSVKPLQWYCFAEAAFYVFLRYYRIHLQGEAIHPPLRSKVDRQALFQNVRAEIHDPTRFISGWFRGAEIEEIGRDDLKDYLSWAFWEGRTTAEDEVELEEITKEVEKMIGKRKFKPGRGSVKSIRLTLDHVEMDHRSLLWYSIILLIDTTTHLRLLIYGMRYYCTLPTSFGVFPPRPLALATASGRSPAPKLSYWLRPHTSKTRLPVLYLHGIGVGLHPHVEFLHQLDAKLNANTPPNDQVGIMCIEILQISSRLTHSILDRSEFLTQLTQVLDQHDFKRLVLLSHSYGSVLSTHMLTDDAMAARVAATLMVDPVTILLHMPDVAYNFTARAPTHANEWQLWYFASKDPGTAHTLGRHFFWSQNVLWRERIMELVDRGMRLTASLSSRDLIVDTEAVGRYLVNHEIPDPVLLKDKKANQEHMELEVASKKKKEKREVGEAWKVRKFGGKGLEVLWWEDLDHAQVFDQAGSRAKLVDVLVEYSRSS